MGVNRSPLLRAPFREKHGRALRSALEKHGKYAHLLILRQVKEKQPNQARWVRRHLSYMALIKEICLGYPRPTKIYKALTWMRQFGKTYGSVGLMTEDLREILGNRISTDQMTELIQHVRDVFCRPQGLTIYEEERNGGVWRCIESLSNIEM